MRRVVCRSIGSPAELVVEETPELAVRPGHVVIAVTAAGVNFTDLLMTGGRYQDQHTTPFVPGSEVAGTIVRSGAGVDAGLLGTRVLAVCRTGGFADEVMMPADQVVAVPDSVDLDAAAAFPIAFGTAYRALVDRAGLRPGERLLVLGSSGALGTAAVSVGGAVGAEVFVAGADAARMASAVRAGAVAVVAPDPADLVTQWRQLRGREGVDVVIDAVGGGWGTQAQRILSEDGRYVVVGYASGEFPAIAANRLLMRNLTVHGVFGGPFLNPNNASQSAAVDVLIDGLAQGRWGPHIARRLPLDQASAALVELESRAHQGRILLMMGQTT
ncbi:NADPH:quinone oxidoreductase family protein [Dactylosporangium cerinum]|uniref:NADPH:quinone oxidoreductase family protein n=1 Tax=Dactylosporangium cerinum TaxID=1434730 RepID=A0ABV9VXF5_9ACTN